MMHLSSEDLEQLAATGHTVQALEEQLAVMAKGAARLRVHRPATTGDGIRVLEDAELGRLQQAHDQAAEAGRIGSFVPASGAATRMCHDLIQAWHNDYRDLSETHPGPIERARAILLHAPDLAVWEELADKGAEEGDARSILTAMFADTGLGLQSLPKGLVPFHPSPDGARTAFEEHLVEATRLGKDAHGTVRAHFTVGQAHRKAFEERLEAVARRLASRAEARLEVGFSVQDPATDTLAATPAFEPFRTDDGRLFFRPGGHGALLRNLAALGGDIVLVKNIDNVVPEDLRGPNLPWRKRLSGLLVVLQGRAYDLVRRLRRGDGIDEAVAFLRDELAVACAPDPEALIARLNRPWRVCGMVRNEGQPGGGPFWADSPDGVTLQIVEGVQIDTDDAGQAAVLAASTHFNPVDMALGLRDVDGRPFDLNDYTDPGAVIVTAKHHHGHPLLALEHPGLWNGGMARWNTVFAEVPAYTFQPVKTFSDLLLCAHGGPLC